MQGLQGVIDCAACDGIVLSKLAIAGCLSKSTVLAVSPTTL